MIAGGKGWFYESLFTRVTQLGLIEDVLFTGYVPGDELPWWYRAAALFVFPSLFEGFGLPVLEAMACGIPTITSTASSLPEVAGEAAILVDPNDQEGLVSAMERVLNDARLRSALAEAGVQQARKYPWSRTAVETMAVYRYVLAGVRQAEPAGARRGEVARSDAPSGGPLGGGAA